MICLTWADGAIIGALVLAFGLLYLSHKFNQWADRFFN